MSEIEFFMHFNVKVILRRHVSKYQKTCQFSQNNNFLLNYPFLF